MGNADAYDCELRLGLPGTKDLGGDVASEIKSNKRLLTNICQESGSLDRSSVVPQRENAPANKAQIVGWPPIRSYRKNSIQSKKFGDAEGGGNYVKVSMDGAPYLRKIDLDVYEGYHDLLMALEKMFKITIGNYSEREGYKGSEYAPTYEDKDGDWMLVGDVPWEMFVISCKKLRIMRGSDAT